MINNFLLIFKELNIENKNIKIFGNNAIPPYRNTPLEPVFNVPKKIKIN